MSSMASSNKGRLFNAKDLPTIPSYHMKIVKLIEDGGYSMDDLSALIERDPVISSKVLRLVNSPYYNLYAEIASVNKAIVLLGANLLRGLVLSTSLFQSADELLPGLWDHSYFCSIVAAYLADRLLMRNIEDIMTGALLHDIGKIVIRKELPEESKLIDQLIFSEEIPMIEAEKRVLGVTHCDTGSFLAENWNFPSLIKDIISFHHFPSLCLLHKKEAAVSHLADFIVKGIGVSYSRDIFVPALDEEVLKSLSMPEEELPDILAGVLELADNNPVFSKYLIGGMNA